MKIESPNYTQMPNVAIDYWIPRLKPAAGIVLIILCRKTFGWHKTTDTISKNQLCKASGLSKNTIQGALVELEKNGLVQTHHLTNEYGNQPNTYSLCVSKPDDALYSEPDQNFGGSRSKFHLGVGQNLTQGVGQNLTQGVGQNLTPQKKDITKEKKEIYSPPEGAEKPPPSSSTLSDPSKQSDAHQLCEFLFKKIKEIKPNFTGKITPSGTKAAEKLLKLRTKKEIGQIIDFALKDEFWSTFCLSPGKILKHLDSLELQLAKGTSSPSSKSPIAKTEENKEFIEKIEKMFPQAISKGSIRTGYNYIQFIYGPMGSDEIKTSENGFKERVLCNLQKLNLPIKQLKE